MGSKGFSHLINVGVGTGSSEVICRGVDEKVPGLGECKGKEVEYGRGPLKDPYLGIKGGGEGKVVSAAGCTTF